MTNTFKGELGRAFGVMAEAVARKRTWVGEVSFVSWKSTTLFSDPPRLALEVKRDPWSTPNGFLVGIGGKTSKRVSEVSLEWDSELWDRSLAEGMDRRVGMWPFTSAKGLLLEIGDGNTMLWWQRDGYEWVQLLDLPSFSTANELRMKLMLGGLL